jgi:hypothetical protein
MSDDLTVTALLEKRTELAQRVQELQATIYHIDATLAAFGHGKAKTFHRRFANGELIRLIGEAERANVTSHGAVARWVVTQKGWDWSDKVLAKRVVASVKECRKRLNARGA